MKSICIIFVIMFFVSCSEKTADFKHQPNDTVRTPIIFYSPELKDYRLDVVYRISTDSLAFIDVDSSTKKKHWTRVHLYFAGKLDTVRAENGSPKIDSSGKVLMGVNYYYVPSLFVKGDMNLSVDSLVKAEKK